MSETPNTPDASPPKQVRGPVRRWVERVLWAFVILLLVVFFVVAGAYLYLSSPRGEAEVRKRALAAANDALAGRIEAEKVSLSGRWIRVKNAKLYDPEGNLVAEVAEVAAKAKLSDLLDDRIRVDEARISSPRLYLELDADGTLNLTRAVQAKKKALEKPDGGSPASVEFSLGALHLTDGYFRLRQEGRLPAETVVENVKVDGNLGFLAEGKKWWTEGQVSGDVTAPYQAPLSVKAEVGGENGSFFAKGGGNVAGLLLDVDGEMKKGGDAEVRKLALTVPPELPRALLGEWPLLPPVQLEGTLTKRGAFSDLSLEAKSGGAKAVLDATVDVATFAKNDVSLELTGVNLAELFEGLPKSSLGLSVTAKGGGTTLQRLDAEATVKLPPGTYNGGAVGPLSLEAKAKDGVFSVGPFEASLPGVKLSLEGSGTPEKLSGKGRVAASDLRKLSASLEPLLGAKVPKVAGSGVVSFTVGGSLKHPSVSAEAEVPSFAYGPHAVTGLSLSAKLPDATRPLEATGTLRVKSAQLSGQTFRDVSADLATRGRAIEADVSTNGPADLSLHVKGVLDEDAKGAALSELALRLPEGEWSLVSPAKVRFSNGFSVDELSLSSGNQALLLRGGLGEGRVDAEVEAHRLELSRLPRAFVPEKLGIDGVLNATVQARGALPKPRVLVSLQGSGLAAMGHRDVDLALEATWERGRIRGELDAEAFGAFLFLDVDAPAETLMQRRNVPLSLSATVSGVDVAKLLAEFGVEDLALKGVVDATVEVTGTAKAPDVRVSVDGRQVVYGALPPADLALVVSTREDRTLYGQLELDALGGGGSLLLKTPLTIDGVWTRPPSGDEWLALPFGVDLSLKELDLSPLHAAGILPVDLRGKLSGGAKLSGTARAPLGELSIDWKGASYGTGRPGDLRLTARSLENRVDAKLLAKVGGQNLLEVDALAESSVERLQVEDSAVRTPMSLKARVGTVSLAELRKLLPAELVQAPGEDELSGNVTLELEASGSAMAPKVRLRGLLDRIGLGALAVGKGELLFDYEGGRPVLDVSMTTPQGGALRLSGESRMNLSYPAVKRLSPLEAPVQAELSAKKFDLSFLSNITPMVRAMGGTLEAQALINGPLGAPEVEGKIELHDGLLALIGYGEYRDIELSMAATSKEVRLERLTVRAGNGALSMAASADRRGKVYVMSAQAVLKNFPVVFNDQLQAIVSLRTTAKGEITPKMVNIRELAIPEATVELPQVARKDLQDLDRPNDVVLVRKGVPLPGQKRRKTAAEEEKKREEKGVDGSGARYEGRQYSVVVNAPRNLWVRGADIGVELGVSEGFRIDVADTTTIFGEVRALRGRADVLGRRFDVGRDSNVRFTGPAKQPFINVTAVHVNEREGVTVTIAVRGQGSDITIKPSSQPPLPESEIYTLIATGRRTLKRGSGTSVTGSAQAASILGSLLTSQLKKSVLSKLPLDVLSIEAGDEGISGAKVEAGTYLSDKLYIGYTGQVGADPSRGENSNAVELEYQISPRWSFELEVGDAKAGAADLIWSKDY